MDINSLKVLINEIDNSGMDFFYYCDNEISIKIIKQSDVTTWSSSKAINNSEVSQKNQAFHEIAADIQSVFFKEIKSQYVGIVKLNDYKTLNPYVKIGQNINKGDMLCIIEYLNIHIKIKSNVSGIISSIDVKENEIVDYGKVLFNIKME